MSKYSRKQVINAIATTNTKTAAIGIIGCDKATFYKLIKLYELTEEELKGLPKELKITIGELELRAALEKHDFNQSSAGIELGKSKSAVGVAMVYYGITKVPRCEQIGRPSNFKALDIPKDIIINALKSHSSVRNAAKFLDISKEKMYAYIELYDIPTKQSKNKAIDWDEVRKDLFERRISIIEVCSKYLIRKRDIERKHIDVSSLTTEYTNEELRRIFDVVDFNNQGIIKALKLLDVNVFKSIMLLTEDHIVTTDKLTERCYRIINDYTPEQIDPCKWCGDNLLFYTMKLGYGNSDNNTCDKCTANISGVSIPSQKLFWDIYNTTKKECWFSELNREYVIDISKQDKLFYGENCNMNEKYYAVDFCYSQKIIEYGTDYFRKTSDKEIFRKKFLEYKGYQVLFVSWKDHQKNPEQVLQRCLDFLKD